MTSAERQRKHISSMTPAERAAFRKRDAKKHKKRFAHMSEAERAAIRKHRRELYAQKQAAMSEEERTVQRAKRLAQSRKYRASLSEAKREKIADQNRERFAQLPDERKAEIRARSCEYNRQLRLSLSPAERDALNAARRQNYDPFAQRLYKMNSTPDPEKRKANRHRVYLRMKADPVRMAKRMEYQRRYRDAHRAELAQRQAVRQAGARSSSELDILRKGGLL